MDCGGSAENDSLEMVSTVGSRDAELFTLLLIKLTSNFYPIFMVFGVNNLVWDSSRYISSQFNQL